MHFYTILYANSLYICATLLFACSDVIHGNVCLMWHFTFQRRVGGNCSFPILWWDFRCTAVGHLSIVERQLILAASCWALRLAFIPTSIFAPSSSFSPLDFWLLVGRSFYCCGRILMSDSEGSSDTTHESILHNLVQHHLNLHREVAALRRDVQALQGTTGQWAHCFPYTTCMEHVALHIYEATLGDSLTCSSQGRLGAIQEEIQGERKPWYMQRPC